MAKVIVDEKLRDVEIHGIAILERIAAALEHLARLRQQDMDRG